MSERLLWPGLSWSLSCLLPLSHQKLRSSREPTAGVSGGWGTGQLHNALGCASERLFLCRRSWAVGPLPQPVLPTSSPSIWCSIFSLRVVTRPSRGSWCPGSDLTLLIYSSFPQGKGVQKRLPLLEHPARKGVFPGGPGEWVLESESLSPLPWASQLVLSVNRPCSRTWTQSLLGPRPCRRLGRRPKDSLELVQLLHGPEGPWSPFLHLA